MSRMKRSSLFCGTKVSFSLWKNYTKNIYIIIQKSLHRDTFLHRLSHTQIQTINSFKTKPTPGDTVQIEGKQFNIRRRCRLSVYGCECECGHWCGVRYNAKNLQWSRSTAENNKFQFKIDSSTLRESLLALSVSIMYSSTLRCHIQFLTRAPCAWSPFAQPRCHFKYDLQWAARYSAQVERWQVGHLTSPE